MSLRTNIKHAVDNFYLLKVKTFRRSLCFSSTLSNTLELTPKSQLSLSTTKDPYTFLKDDPIQVCFSIWVKAFSSPPTVSFPNLTGFLSKFGLWVLAYQRSCAHVTGTFPPISAIHSNVLHDLLSLRNVVVRNQFLWNNKTHQYIRSPNDKSNDTKFVSQRKIESNKACFQDRVVQEVLIMVLEPLFEARFSVKSLAFRPGRSAHTVIRMIRSNFAGYLWFLRGDLTEIYENVDIHLMMRYIEKVTKDNRVLGLIETALRAHARKRLERHFETELTKKRKKGSKKKKKKKILNANEPKPDPYWLRTFFDFAPEEATKVPSYGHCGILSPLLANVYLNELDHMMEDKIVEFFQPSKLHSIWKDTINDGCHNPSWPEFVPSSGKEKTRKMDYIRYGGHFLIGIRGSREDATNIRKQIIEFCENEYGFRLDNSKLEIEHIARGIQFLDHIVCRRMIHPTLHYTTSGGKTVSRKGVGTLLSVTASLQQCIRHFRRLELVKGDKNPEPLPCTPMLYSSQAHTNAQMNKFLETMADWYRYADNRKKIVSFCTYVIRSSMAKLYAARYRLKSRAKVYKRASRNLSRPLRDNSSNSAPDYSDLLRMGLVDAIEGVQFSHMSLIPSCDYTPFSRKWVPEHERVLNEYIRLEDPKFFCDLYGSIKRKSLILPQDEISEILWDFKTVGVHNYQYNDEKITKTSLAELSQTQQSILSK